MSTSTKKETTSARGSAPLFMPVPLRLTQAVKYTATTTGRDKIYRFVQYLCKALAYYLAQGTGAKDRKEWVNKITSLVKHISLSRKLLRIGRPLEYAQNLIAGLGTQKDIFLRNCIIGKNSLLSAWMLFDFLQWAQGVGIWKSKNPSIISRRTYQFWAYGLIFGLSSTIYQLHSSVQRLITLQNSLQQPLSTEAQQKTQEQETATAIAARALLRQLFQESLDFLIPAKGLGWVNVSDGFIGLTGALTSLLGATSQWRKVNPPK